MPGEVGSHDALKVQQRGHGSAAQQPFASPWHFGCNLSERRHLVRALTRAAAAVGFAVLLGGAYLTPQLATSDDGALAIAPASPANMPAVTAVTSGDDRDAGDPNDAFTDLDGNEVSDAIATYKFDQSGSLYELHSPQTELPRLGIPKI